MKRKSLVVLTLLLVAALMAGIGTGAIDVFSANRAAAMKVVNDADALISLVGDKLYAKEDSIGRLNLDFTNTEKGGKGFNPYSYSEFHDVFTVTNKSEKTVKVWLEGNPNPHHIRYMLDTYTPGQARILYDNNPEANVLYADIERAESRASIELEPGESFTVKILAKMGDVANGRNFDHTITVKAESVTP